MSQLDEVLRTADAENRRQGEAIAQLRAGSAALEQARNDLLARLAKQKTWVEEQTRFFEEKITTVTTKLMEEKSQAFTEVNKKEMDAVVTPFREQLGEFRERVDTYTRPRIGTRASCTSRSSSSRASTRRFRIRRKRSPGHSRFRQKRPVTGAR